MFKQYIKHVYHTLLLCRRWSTVAVCCGGSTSLRATSKPQHFLTYFSQDGPNHLILKTGRVRRVYWTSHLIGIDVR